jgi:hypothetical protein
MRTVSVVATIRSVRAAARRKKSIGSARCSSTSTASTAAQRSRDSSVASKPRAWMLLQ